MLHGDYHRSLKLMSNSIFHYQLFKLGVSNVEELEQSIMNYTVTSSLLDGTHIEDQFLLLNL